MDLTLLSILQPKIRPWLWEIAYNLVLSKQLFSHRRIKHILVIGCWGIF
jgi:hypothetical protein